MPDGYDTRLPGTDTVDGMANLTPEDVRRIAFRKPPIGRRGYDEEEVDVFLDEVERTLTALYEQIARLGGGSAPAAPASSSAPIDATAAELAEIKATLARIEARLSTSGSSTPGGSFF